MPEGQVVNALLEIIENDPPIATAIV
ncbi:hypothetical protein LCGC14_3003350, partial [marine sediment metagenome]